MYKLASLRSSDQTSATYRGVRRKARVGNQFGSLLDGIPWKNLLSRTSCTADVLGHLKRQF